MSKKPKINAAILIIGNEILSGRTLDLNSNFIAKRCSKIGIKLCEIKIIPDSNSEIIKTVIQASKKYKYVFIFYPMIKSEMQMAM